MPPRQRSPLPNDKSAPSGPFWSLLAGEFTKAPRLLVEISSSMRMTWENAKTAMDTPGRVAFDTLVLPVYITNSRPERGACFRVRNS